MVVADAEIGDLDLEGRGYVFCDGVGHRRDGGDEEGGKMKETVKEMDMKNWLYTKLIKRSLSCSSRWSIESGNTSRVDSRLNWWNLS